MPLQMESLASVNKALYSDSILEQSGNGAIQVFPGNDTSYREGKNVFVYEDAQEQLSEFRRLFIQNLNEGRYFYPVSEENNQTVLYKIDFEVENPISISSIPFVNDAAVAITIGGSFFGVAGAVAGLGFVAGLCIGNYIAENLTDPFVANIYLFDKIILNGNDITDYVLDYSQNFVSAYSNWYAGSTENGTVAFLGGGVFSPKLIDSNNQVISKIFGTDTFIAINSGGKALGFVVYNDSAITGREVLVTDDLQITLTAVTELPKQSTNFSEDVSGKPVIDLRAYSGEVEVGFDATRGENTLDDNLIGFYKILDSRGGIDISGEAVADLHPGDSGYAAAAIQNREDNIIIKGSTKFTAELEGGNIYAPFIAVNGTLQNLASAAVYFGFSKANSDGRSHVQLNGSNGFGFEDLLWLGDRSFSDMVIIVTKPSSSS